MGEISCLKRFGTELFDKKQVVLYPMFDWARLTLDFDRIGQESGQFSGGVTKAILNSDLGESLGGRTVLPGN